MERVPMMDAVAQTKAVGEAMKSRNWDYATELRGKSFARNIQMYHDLAVRKSVQTNTDGSKEKPKIAVMNIGAPAAGINSAIRAIVRNCINNNATPVVIKDGIGGLLAPNGVHEYNWWDVHNFNQHGGTNIGTTRNIPSDFGIDRITQALKAYGISGLIIIGGFEACKSARELYTNNCPIPIIVIPATLSNNIAETEITIGADTALNVVVDATDRVKISANGTKGRVFIVETMGGYCGYLASTAGLSAGADCVYIDENPVSTANILHNVSHLISKMRGPVKRGIVMRNNTSSQNFTTDVLDSIYSEEGRGVFDVRTITLGHTQQGGAPSPYDRSYATKCGYKASKVIIKHLNDTSTQNSNFCQMICMNRKKMSLKDVPVLTETFDTKKRRPLHQWWLSLLSIQRIMAKYSDQDFQGEMNEYSEITTHTKISHMGLLDHSKTLTPQVSHESAFYFTDTAPKPPSVSD